MIAVGVLSLTGDTDLTRVTIELDFNYDDVTKTDVICYLNELMDDDNLSYSVEFQPED